MRKEYNIVEASRMKNTEFEVYYTDGVKRRVNVKTNKFGYFYNTEDDELVTLSQSLLQASFVKYRKPITVQEAAVYLDSGRDVECEIDGKTYLYKHGICDKAFADENGNAVSYREIISGQWYLTNEED